MTLNLKKIKNYVITNVNPKINQTNTHEDNQPEIGFKIAYSPNEKQIKIKIISARHLPSYYGNNKAQGFLTKVCYSFHM